MLSGGFALGRPIGLGVLMLRRVQEYSGNSDGDRFVARRVADEQKISDVEAADAIRGNPGRRAADRKRLEHPVRNAAQPDTEGAAWIFH